MVTGDVLRKKYIMLTKFYFVSYVHKGAAEFLYREMTVATYLGGGGDGTDGTDGTGRQFNLLILVRLVRL